MASRSPSGVRLLFSRAWQRRREVAQWTGRTTVLAGQIFCLVHLFNEHICQVSPSTGTSMLPTLAIEGDILLHIRLPFLRFCTETSQRFSSLLSFSSSSPSHADNDLFYSSRTWGHQKIGGPASIKTDQTQGTGLRIGDLVVALSPADPNRTVCKRVLGLPGDTICVDPRMRPIPEERWRGRNSPSPSSSCFSSSSASAPRQKTATFSDSEVDLLDSIDSSSGGGKGIDRSTLEHDQALTQQQTYLRTRGEVQYVTVPSGHVWLVGDNLSNSTDSRHYGPVPMGLLRGKVLARAFPNPAWLPNNTS